MSVKIAPNINKIRLSWGQHPAGRSEKHNRIDHSSFMASGINSVSFTEKLIFLTIILFQSVIMFNRGKVIKITDIE